MILPREMGWKVRVISSDFLPEATGNLLIKHAVKICEGSRGSVPMELATAKAVSMFLNSTFPNGFVESLKILKTINRSVATFFCGK